ncbi:unnamed protein product [Effrenium voratum]|nr:unnamed protein product [Effrenium voratum]
MKRCWHDHDPKKVFGVAWGCTPTPKKLFSQSEIKARHAVEGSEPTRFGTKAAVSGSEAQSAVVAAGLAAATALPQQALAVRAASEDDGFDLRIVAVLALPLFAVSWALFNVWRVAFRQVGRIGESAKGNAL